MKCYNFSDFVTLYVHGEIRNPAFELQEDSCSLEFREAIGCGLALWSFFREDV